jgi:hypothetical protein
MLRAQIILLLWLLAVKFAAPSEPKDSFLIERLSCTQLRYLLICFSYGFDCNGLLLKASIDVYTFIHV